jgi:hypothetical protein
VRHRDMIAQGFFILGINETDYLFNDHIQ